MRNMILAVLAVIGVPGVGRQPNAPTRTFQEVTHEVRGLLDAGVPDSSVAKYIAAMSFRAHGNGTKGNVKRCHECPSDKTVKLEISSELGTTGLNDGNLGRGGRIVARMRNVDLLMYRKQEDLDLGFHDEAYLWIAGTQRSPGVYDAAWVRIDGATGKRTNIVKGRMWYCQNADGSTAQAGDARWIPPHSCKEPSSTTDKAKIMNFHLTSWFSCDQGCCIFADDPI